MTAMAACALIHPTLAAAPGNGNGAIEIQAEVTNVSEHRQPGGKCYVSLKFTGNSLTNIQGILKVRATRAVDEVGTNLLPTDEVENVGRGISGGLGRAALRGWYDERPLNSWRATVALRNASRSAKTIKELAGEVHLYSPTIQNGGAAVIEDIRAQPGAILQDSALEKLDIRLTYVTKEAYESSSVLSKSASALGRKLILPEDQAADALFPGILGDPKGTPGNYVVLRLDDPQQAVTGFAFREPGGRLLPVRQQRSAKGMRAFYFDTLIPEKLALVVYLEVPESVKRVPFKLENIALP